MKKLIAKFAALTLMAGALPIAGAATAEGQRSKPADQASIVSVHGTGDRVTLSRSSVAEGRINFKVDTSSSGEGGSQITLFRLAKHATLAQFKADLKDVFSETDPLVAARGTRHLTRDARFFGLADVVKGTPAKVTVRLERGSYYLMDLGMGLPANGPKFTTFTVLKSGGGGLDRVDLADRQGGTAHGLPTVKMTSGKRFDTPNVLPANGTIRVRNRAGTIHFMSMIPVKSDTTDAKIKKALKAGDFSFAQFDRPFVGLDVLSPGKRAELTYKLKPGKYALMCFVPDAKTGEPHALMGMHKVVTLK